MTKVFFNLIFYGLSLNGSNSNIPNEFVLNLLTVNDIWMLILKNTLVTFCRINNLTVKYYEIN